MKANSGNDGSTPGEAEDHVEDDERRSRARPRTTGSPSRSAAAARSAPAAAGSRIEEHDDERDRDDHPRVARRRLAHVVLDRRRPADEHARPAGLLRRRAQRRDEVERLGGVRLGSSMALSSVPAAPATSVGSTCATPSRLLERARDRLRRRASCGHDHLGRRARAGRERLGEQLLALERLDRRRGRRRPGSGRC